MSGALAEHCDKLDTDGATVVVVDLDAGRDDEMHGARAADGARRQLAAGIVAITQTFDEDVARTLLQMRVADFLVKPVAPLDLVRACARVAQGAEQRRQPTEAKIYTFLPAVGGAGVTTLAVQTAMLLLNSGGRAASRRPAWSISISSTARRRLSRPRAASQSGEIEPRPGSARPATARGHALGSCVRPGGDRGAQPPGRDALVRSRCGDAAARSGVDAISNMSCSTCRAPGSPGPTAC